MSFYVHKTGKRGRPTRFDDKDFAILSSIVTLLDARRHKRGRTPGTKMLSIVDDGDVIAIADTVTGDTYTIHDSCKDPTARTGSVVTVTKSKVGKSTKKHSADLHPYDLPAPKTEVKTITPRSIDLSKIKDKIRKLEDEASIKKLDVT